ncbi:MAG: hypothetical protein PHG69_00685 [Candidatus Omnitrophica bacterium]|nr:hypothetical protein [Candidatus Omnitrophota bacterium]
MRKYILIALVILSAVSIFLNFHEKRKMVSLNSDLKRQEELIRKYQSDTGIIPGSVAIVRLKDSSASSEKELNKVLGVFDSKKTILPKDISDKGLYFFQSLHNTMKLLEREATSKKMVLPPVDFSTDVPRETDIPYLLKQLEMIDDIAGIIINVGKCEIATIKPLAIDKTKKFFDFEKLSLQVVLTIDSNALLGVLMEINKHAPVYFMEEFSIVAVEPPRLKVNFVASRILTGVSLEDVAEFRNKEIFDLNNIYPLDVSIKSFSKRNPFFRSRDLAAGEAASLAASSGQSVTKGGKPVPQFTYKGSINTGDKIVGIIEDNWQSKVCFAQAGDLCSGYKVTKIEDAKAVLSKDNQEIILSKGANNEKDNKK